MKTSAVTPELLQMGLNVLGVQSDLGVLGKMMPLIRILADEKPNLHVLLNDQAVLDAVNGLLAQGPNRHAAPVRCPRCRQRTVIWQKKEASAMARIRAISSLLAMQRPEALKPNLIRAILAVGGVEVDEAGLTDLFHRLLPHLEAGRYPNVAVALEDPEIAEEFNNLIQLHDLPKRGKVRVTCSHCANRFFTEATILVQGRPEDLAPQ